MKLKKPRTPKPDLEVSVAELAPLPDELPTWERDVIVPALVKLLSTEMNETRREVDDDTAR